MSGSRPGTPLAESFQVTSRSELQLAQPYFTRGLLCRRSWTSLPALPTGVPGELTRACGLRGKYIFSETRSRTVLPGGIKQIENVPLGCKQTILKHSSCGVMMLFRVFPGNLIRHIDILTNRKGIGRNYAFPSLGKVWASWPVLCVSLTCLQFPCTVCYVMEQQGH